MDRTSPGSNVLKLHFFTNLGGFIVTNGGGRTECCLSRCLSSRISFTTNWSDTFLRGSYESIRTLDELMQIRASKRY
ncbi:unnamed protein product [Taenia asiatica]|uniref:Uncharacterized protein n=1 Tax=Taenia asiatica TaxID=60517 RepID=A0A3P6QLI4_TAEAS|nr:unnamed protein product [Taenia asiatica]